MYPIPANATRIRYLESTGTQYVDTGVVPTFPEDLTYIASVSWNDTASRKIMGRQGGFYFGPVNGYFQPGLGGSGASSIPLAPNQFHSVEIRFVGSSHGADGPRYFTVDGSSGSATEIFNNDPSATAPIWVFQANNATALRGQSRVASFSIVRRGTTLRSFVPVRVGSVGYLFDRVSGQLFGNAGTGDFVLGPDTFSQGVVPTRMMAMGVRKKEALGSVAFTRGGGLSTPLYAAGVLSSIPSAWTISLWAKAASTPEYGAFFKLGNQSPGSGAGLGFGSSTFESGNAGTNLVAIRERYAWSSFGTVAPINSWHHYVLSVNGRTLAAYKDGSLVSSNTNTLFTDGVCDISIGNGHAMSPLSNEKRSFAGNITRLVLWDRSLSASEVAQDYADGKNAPTTTSGLQHYWPMSNAKNYLKDEVGAATLTAGSGGVTISTDTPFA